MVSETVQKALAKAAQRAARRAEADAGLGGEDEKEASRQGTRHHGIE